MVTRVLIRGRRRGAAVAVVAAFLLIGVINSLIVPARAAFPGANGQIVFVSNRDDTEEDIYVMEADGANPIRLTMGEGQELNPSWSPDGTQIVYFATQGNAYQIFVMDADGGNQIPLTDDEWGGQDPAWSPDGTQIAFARFDPDTSSSDIWVMDADGSDLVNLTKHPAYDVEPNWSPDGTRIIFETDRVAEFGEIFVMDADGGNPTNLTNNAVGWDGRPDWSPDGTQIAFHSDREDGIDVYVMDSDGSNQINLTETGSAAMAAWSPDGTQIAFMSDLHDISVIEVAGGGIDNLTDNDDFDTLPNWQPLMAPSYDVFLPVVVTLP